MNILEFKEIVISSARIVIGAAITSLLVLQFLKPGNLLSNMPFSEGWPILAIMGVGMLVLIGVEWFLRVKLD